MKKITKTYRINETTLIMLSELAKNLGYTDTGVVDRSIIRMYEYMFGEGSSEKVITEYFRKEQEELGGHERSE